MAAVVVVPRVQEMPEVMAEAGVEVVVVVQAELGTRQQQLPMGAMVRQPIRNKDATEEPALTLRQIMVVGAVVVQMLALALEAMEHQPLVAMAVLVLPQRFRVLL